MNTTTFRHLFLAAGITLASAFTADAQTLYVANAAAGRIETFNATTAAPINNSFVTGLTINAVFGVTGDTGTNILYVADYGTGVKAYDATTGTPIAGFTLNAPGALDVQVSGSTLYVTSNGGVGTYNAATGAAINASFITSSTSEAAGITVTGGKIFVASPFANSVSAYNATTGATVSDPFLSGLDRPWFITSSGSVLYVANAFGGNIGSYDPTTGVAINANLVTTGNPYGVTYANNVLYASNGSSSINLYDATTGAGLAGRTVPGANYNGLTVIGVPEPGTVGLFSIGGLAVAFGFLKRRKAT